MKRTISTLALAAPLAAVALSLGATPAMAQPAEPIDELTIAALGPEIQPEIPEEELPQPEDPQPEDPELPDGPDGIKDKDPCPTHGPCGDDEKDPGDGDDFDKPNRVDAGSGTNDGGMELARLIAGGGLITAAGAAYAVRRRASMGA